MAAPKRPIRVGGASGGFTDRQRAIHDLAKNCNVDVIVGDWMSECTMTIHGATKVANAAKALQDQASTYDQCFLGSIGPGLRAIQDTGTKIAVYAGASDPSLLARDVKNEITRQGLSLKVAYIEGDEVTEQFNELRRQGDKFTSLDTGKPIDEWDYTPIYAQAYLGAQGIKAAFEAGADIIICGRVADASPTIGAAAWWHGWTVDQVFDELAASLVAGHLIECSSYVTGGYYSGFKDLMDGCDNLGFPIAAIESNGETIITKEANTGGLVSVGTVTSQLVYEIQGPLYYNSDVTASLEGIKIEQVSVDEVRVSGVKGLPPPPTTKVGVTAHGGYQAEFQFIFSGLDIKEKAAWTERQIRRSMGKNSERFSVLKFQLVGACAEDPEDQVSNHGLQCKSPFDIYVEANSRLPFKWASTVLFRVFRKWEYYGAPGSYALSNPAILTEYVQVQTKDPDVMGIGSGSMASMAGASFTRWCMENFLQSAPGASVAPDNRQASAKAIFAIRPEYWPTLLPQSVIKQRVCLEWSDETIDIAVPQKTQEYSGQQPSYETKDPVDLCHFGPTTRAPLGYVVLGRSGDKASNANVGFFVRSDDEWAWLRSLLSTDKLIQLLGEREYLGHGVDRFEMPNIRTVHFLVKDHLDRGFNSSSTAYMKRARGSNFSRGQLSQG
ncbi:hypothetical protein GGR57DRAFT_504644 [Xylariaceae sp. FL1272]|nr:hypothetical protein GGR57DRAFT_504644 [Xylariaceae sp. FL1272]